MTKPDTITINDVRYVREDSVIAPILSDDNYVIVRCRNAGVHAGTLVSRKDGIVRLENSRRLWRWWSKFTLSGLATEGPLSSKMKQQKYACVLPLLDLTESDVCEVIPCTAEARDAIRAVPEHSNG